MSKTEATTDSQLVGITTVNSDLNPIAVISPDESGSPNRVSYRPGKNDMRELTVALAQIDTTLGDFRGNASVIHEWSRKAYEAGARLVVFPEMTLTGYPLHDLSFRPAFARASQAAVKQLAKDLAADGLGELAVVLGYLDVDGPVVSGNDPIRVPRNAAAVLFQGQVAARYFKHHLPNHGVFNGARNFVPGHELALVRVAGVDVALTVGEDSDGVATPFAAAAQARAGLVLHLSATPFLIGQSERRTTTLRRLARAVGAPVASVNLVGGQDELVFGGDSMIVAPDGQLLGRAARFEQELMLATLLVQPADAGQPADGHGPLPVRSISLGAPDRTRPTWPMPEAAVVPTLQTDQVSEEAAVWAALVAGLRGYAHKNGFTSAVVAVSGGIDSSVVAAIAADALGPERVKAISMPSGCSSDHSQSDAAELGARLGLDFRMVPIQEMVDRVVHALAIDALAIDGVALENVQARIRSVVLMAVSNQEGRLALNTGNKTEYSIGHNTLYGDQVGGYALLKDVPKTLVWALARWRNTVSPVIPENIITKEPSPELQPGQLDSQLLPAPYEVLDEILAGYVDADLSRDELISAGWSADVVDQVIEMVERGEFKRHQAPVGPKISVRAFGRDRQLPITNRFVDHGVSATFFLASA